MSNWIDYRLDVLASSPEEINRIAARLKQPSSKLVDWVAERFHQQPSEVATGLTKLVSFEPVENLFYVHESVNKARCWRPGVRFGADPSYPAWPQHPPSARTAK